MRKQDRILQEKGTRPSDEPRDPKSPPRPSDQVKGSASSDQPHKPPRQPGKLPLPD